MKIYEQNGYSEKTKDGLNIFYGDKKEISEKEYRKLIRKGIVIEDCYLKIPLAEKNGKKLEFTTYLENDKIIGNKLSPGKLVSIVYLLGEECNA